MTNLRRLCLGVTLLGLLLSGVAAAADGASYSFESGIDFRAFRTFSIRDGRINSPKPEVDNRLFRQRMRDSIRTTLTKQQLQEVGGNADFVVTYEFSDADFSEVQRNGPIRVPPIPGQQPGFVVPPSGPRPLLFTEGVLVIDIHDAAGTLIWRGTYRNRERSGPALSRQLSGDARTLLSKFPPRKR